MHSDEPDPIFHAPRRPRKGPGKLLRRSGIGCHDTTSIGVRAVGSVPWYLPAAITRGVEPTAGWTRKIGPGLEAG